MESPPEIVVSGDRWLGRGFLSVYSKIEDMINNAEHSILLAVYQISSDYMISLIKNALNRGVRVEVFCSSISNTLKHRNLKVYVLRDITLHAKLIIVDGERILIGSSNYTFSGFFKNYEVGVYFENETMAYELRKMIKELIV